MSQSEVLNVSDSQTITSARDTAARAQATVTSGAPPDANRIDVGKLAVLCVQLIALALVIRYFQLETQAFYELSVLAYAGFVVHYFLPLPYRLPFFAVLSLTGIGLVLGVRNALVVFSVGLGLIGICHLPVRLPWRLGLLLTMGGLLALWRGMWPEVLGSAALWPVLGSMFMFRLIVYAYDRHYDAAPATWPSTLSYFFMLPNVCFPLFPVVDYRTFRRNYYNSERHEIYQRGLRWIGRGLIQLVLYRFVYYYLSMGPTEVTDAGDLGRYVVSGFLLYLRISGHFHVIVGMLLLFGFNLPETHHRYFLASSFNDFWRRINIYWKDFMMKVFYYPMFFRLRKFGTMRALAASTVFVFFATWSLHAYQWFWLRGSYQFSWNDVLFWSILGSLVVANALYEARFGRRRSLGGRPWSWGEQARLVLKTMATFAVICVLWSLWTSESLSAWLSVWEAAGLVSVSDKRLIPAALLGIAGFAGIVIASARLDAARAAGYVPSFRRVAAANLAALAAVALVGTPELYALLLPTRAAEMSVEVIGSLREVRLSGHDADMVERGYYEQLLNVQNFNSRLWEVYASWPLNWSRLEDTGALRLTGDILGQELVPNKTIHFRDATLTTNRWGMRDRDYTQQKPAGVRRIALVGSSHVMGYGVDDDQTFDAVLEGLLRSEGLPRTRGPFEVLNFAVDGYDPLQELVITERRVLNFGPDVVAYFAHAGAMNRVAVEIAEVVRQGVAIPYPALAEIVAKAGVDRNTTRPDAERRLRPFGYEILTWVYGRYVEQSRGRGAVPVWLYLPEAGAKVSADHLAELTRRAREAGFLTLSLADCYDGHDPEAIWFGAWDHHPNAQGHRLVAEKLLRLIREHETSMFSELPPG
jgi:D-alanyl-lipoteichoic acid acyltransferase DltB (MBOAT superfamily)